MINCVRDEHRVWLHRRYSQDGVNDALGTESRSVLGCRNGQAATRGVSEGAGVKVSGQTGWPEGLAGTAGFAGQQLITLY